MTSEAIETLAAELQRRGNYDSRQGFKYDGAADILGLAALATPFVVSALLVFEVLPSKGIAAISALVPGIALVLIRGIKLIDRGRWHWDKAATCYAWLWELKCGSRDPNLIASEFAAFLRNLPATFPSRAELLKDVDKLVAQKLSEGPKK